MHSMIIVVGDCSVWLAGGGLQDVCKYQELQDVSESRLLKASIFISLFMFFLING